MRLIDADALKDALFQIHVHDGEELEPMLYYEDAVQVVDSAPTIDTTPVVRGWWVKEPDRYYHWHCSECGFVDGVHAMISEYCPKCGAKMEGDPDCGKEACEL